MTSHHSAIYYKIIIIVPSAQWMASTGVGYAIKDLSLFSQKVCQLTIIPVQDITEQCIEEAIVIISKVSRQSLFSLYFAADCVLQLALICLMITGDRLSVFRKFHD